MKQYSKGIITTVLVLMFVGLVTATTISNTQITGFTDIIFSNGASIEESGSGLYYTERQVFGNEVNFLGTNLSGTNNFNKINLVGRNEGNDGTGATRRIQLNFWDLQPYGPNNRALSINTHSNFTQPKQISFYANVRNGTWDGKIMEWLWGEDTDNTLYLRDTKIIKFDEGTLKGFYSNISTQNGIKNDDQYFYFMGDADGDQSYARFDFKNSTHTFFTLKDSIITSKVKFLLGGDGLATLGNATNVFLGIDDDNTGIYKPNYNSMTFANNGADTLKLDGSNIIYTYGRIEAGDVLDLNTNILTGVDSIYMTGDRDIDNVERINDLIGFFLQPRVLIDGNSSQVAFGLNDDNTGIYKSAANEFDIATNGQQRLNIDSLGNIAINDLMGAYTGGSAYVCVYDSGEIYASETACP